MQCYKYIECISVQLHNRRTISLSKKNILSIWKETGLVEFKLFKVVDKQKQANRIETKMRKKEGQINPNVADNIGSKKHTKIKLFDKFFFKKVKMSKHWFDVKQNCKKF